MLLAIKVIIKPSKCSFGIRSVNYLGFVLSVDGIRPQQDTVRAVTEFPRPDNVKKVRQFVGMASFYRRFMEGFSLIAAPLT